MAQTIETSEILFYRDLLAVVGTQKNKDLLKQYATTHYNRAMNILKNETDQVKLCRAQGEAQAWARVANMHEDILNILKNAD